MFNSLNLSIDSFAPLKSQPIMGIDWGQTKIGLSLSDPLWVLASPLDVLKRRNGHSVIDNLVGLLAFHHVGGIVVGYPCQEDGTPDRMTKNIERFVHALSQKYLCSVLLWDERFSSQRAEKICPNHRKMDAVAATLILQDVLEVMRQINPQSTL